MTIDGDFAKAERMRRDEARTRKIEEEREETSLPPPLLPQFPISPTSEEERVEFESRREFEKIMQTVRKRDGAPSKSASALDCNQPFPPSVSTFEKEARGFLWPMHQRDRVKVPRKDKNWYAGRVRIRTSTEGRRRRRLVE